MENTDSLKPTCKPRRDKNQTQMQHKLVKPLQQILWYEQQQTPVSSMAGLKLILSTSFYTHQFYSLTAHKSDNSSAKIKSSWSSLAAIPSRGSFWIILQSKLQKQCCLFDIYHEHRNSNYLTTILPPVQIYSALPNTMLP